VRDEHPGGGFQVQNHQHPHEAERHGQRQGRGIGWLGEQHLAQQPTVIGPDHQNFADGARFLITVREFREMTGMQEGIAIRQTLVVTIVVAVIVVAAVCVQLPADLRRNLERAAERGFTFYVHPEMEFFLFEDAEGTEPLDNGSYFDMTPLDVQQDFRRQAINMLERMGISVEFSHHEVAPSQHEIDLRYADALTMADNIMTFRLVVKETALARSIYATFMPKPIEGQWGNAMHLHLSLFEGDTNAFYDPADRYHLSKTAKAFTAGLLRHAREITAITNQWVNSYKRLTARLHGPLPSGEAPIFVSWGHNNRSALIRVPMYKPRKGASTRIEYRAPDPACNPYLAFALLLSAGLKGIEEGYELSDENEDNIFEMTPAERAAAGIERLPASLGEALALMETSELVAETLGEHLFSFFLANKRREWDEYAAHVSQFELVRYLPML
jgi:glutamine synthetase